MSIAHDVEEFKTLKTEIARLSGQTRFLRNKLKDVEARIIDFLREKQQPGVKYQGTAVVMEQKPRRAPKKAKARESDALDVLTHYGISEPKTVLEEVLRARQGNEIESRRIKVKKLPDF